MNELDAWFIATILPHEPSLVRYLHRVWRNRSDIPDICQDVYIRIYESAAKGKPASPKSFLFAIARNLLADKARRNGTVTINYTHDTSALDVLMDELSPEHQYCAGEDCRRLARAYDGLTDNFREVIWLLRVEGLTQKEAAKVLGIKEGTLESRLSRALVALSRAVAEEPARSGARQPKKRTTTTPAVTPWSPAPQHPN